MNGWQLVNLGIFFLEMDEFMILHKIKIIDVRTYEKG